MGRRRRGELDELLEGWARWCDHGGVIAPSGSSMIGKLIDNHGMMFFGSSAGASSPLVDCIEARIEVAVMQMASQHPHRSDVLRLEYSAGWRSVTNRTGARWYNPATADQFDNAKALDCSLRTYRRRLAAARDELQQRLGLL